MKNILSEEILRIKSIMGLEVINEQDVPKGIQQIDNVLINAIEKYIPQIYKLSTSKDFAGYNRNLALNLVRDVAANSNKNINSYGGISKVPFYNPKITKGDKVNIKSLDTKKLQNDFDALDNSEKVEIVMNNMDAMIAMKIINPQDVVDAMKSSNDLDYQWLVWWASNGQIIPSLGGKNYRMSPEDTQKLLNLSFEDFMSKLKIPESLAYTIKTEVGGDGRLATVQSMNPKFGEVSSGSLAAKSNLASSFKTRDFSKSLFNISDNFINMMNNPKKIYDKFISSNDPALSEVKKWLLVPKNRDQFITNVTNQKDINTQYDEGLKFLQRESVLEPEKMSFYQKLTLFCKQQKTYPGGTKFGFFGKVKEVGSGQPQSYEQKLAWCRWFRTWLVFRIIITALGLIPTGVAIWLLKDASGWSAVEEGVGKTTDAVIGCGTGDQIQQFLDGKITIRDGFPYAESDKADTVKYIKENVLYFRDKKTGCNDNQLYLLIPLKDLEGKFDVSKTKQMFVSFNTDGKTADLKEIDASMKDKIQSGYDQLTRDIKSNVDSLKQNVTLPVKNKSNQPAADVSSDDSPEI